MAAITAADVTVTLNPEDIDRSPDGRVGTRTFPLVQFGDGVTQYVALGVPMPPISKFGFHFAIKRAYIENPGNGYIYSFDRANHKVRIWLGAARDAITMAAITAGTPAGNLASNAITFDPHSHDLLIASNATGGNILDAIGANAVANSLVVDSANVFTIDGDDAANGGIANKTQTGVVTGKGLTMDAMATHTHAITGGGAVAEAPLAEMDAAVVLAAATHILYMEMVGR